MNPSPNRIGKFEIIQPIGKGAATAVFLARDTIIGREVALKVIEGSAFPSAEARERFFREAEDAGRLNHPHLVTVHDYGEEAGTVYLAMEYVEGKDLNRIFQEGPLPAQEVLELLAQVCDALAGAHARNRFHRDLRPSNVMITRATGRPVAKVLDLGFTRLAGKVPPLDTPILAPEQAHSGKPDARADVFALGAILYEALAGAPPFAGETPALTRAAILKEDPAPVDPERIATVSPAIQGILDRALAKDPNRRFQSVAALGQALRAARNPGWSPQAEAEELAQAARFRFVPGIPAQPSPRPGLTSAVLWLAVAVALAALGTGGWLLRHRFHRHNPAQVVLQPSLPPPPAPAPVPPPMDPAAAQGDPAAAPGQPAAAPVVAPPAPQPAPAAAPEPPKPKPASGPKSSYRTPEEADAAVDHNPSGVLAYCEQSLAANPDDERAMGLRMAALYALGHYSPCARAMVEAKASGHTILALSLKSPALHRMLQAEKADPKLPYKGKPAPVTPPAP